MLLGVLQDHHNLVLANALKVASGDEGDAYWTMDIGYIWVTNTSLIFIIVMTKQHREYKILRQFLGGGS